MNRDSRTDESSPSPESALDWLTHEQAPILEQLSEGVIIAGADGRLVFVNKAAETLHGVKKLEIAPDAYASSYSLFTMEGEPYPSAKLPLARAVLGGETLVDERWRIRRPDGSEAVAMGTARPLFADGRQIGAVLTVRDDTERFEAESKLRASEERFQLALHAASAIGIWDWDLHTDLVFADARFAEFYSVDPNQAATGAPVTGFLDAIHPDDSDRVGAAIEHAIAGGDDLDVEHRVVAAGRADRWVLVRGLVSHNETGVPIRLRGVVVDITRRKEAEQALHESEQRIATILASAAGAFYAVDCEGNTNLVSRSFIDMMGFGDESEVLGRKLHDLIHHTHPDGSHYPVEECPIYQCASTGVRGHVSNESFYRQDGAAVPVEYWVAPVLLGKEQVGAICTIIDLTERVAAEKALTALNETLELRVATEIAARSEAEDALRQSQKMETLGQLTGGIAHDFNNLLQIIAGNLDILRRNLPEESARLMRTVENAMKGADRAAVLTQRLLAFSRRQPLAPKVVDPNKLVSGMSEMLHRTLGELYSIETVLSSGLWQVEADPNQLESALLNLAVNARDAMDGGGKLTVETANTHLDRSYTELHSGVFPGQYVLICISDTGAGMDRATTERAVEPFFTTKDVGKGTGLGLSMVYGFVKQSGGHLKIYSEPGEGTAVKIYLPRYVGTQGEDAASQMDGRAPEGDQSATILVCEDDEDVRALSAESLRELGYRVVEAQDGETALRLLDGGTLADVLFTDVVLPGISGAVLADRARERFPSLKVLFTTGYARNAIVHHGRLDPGVELLSKPFTYADLAQRIRDLIDSP